MSIESIPRVQNDPVPQPAPYSSPMKQAFGGGNAPKPQTPDMAQSKAIVADIQNNLQVLNNSDLAFSVDGRSGDVVITVTDAETGKVIRQIPAEEVRSLAEKLEEMVGLVFDQPA
ncbi:MAG: flagellar protein FlaG [Desulfobacterales bacterium]